MKEQTLITLSSTAPLDDGGRKYNKLYFALGIIGAIVGIPNGGLTGAALIGLFGIAIAYAIKSAIIGIKLKKLRKAKFSIKNKLPYETIIEKLIPNLSPLGMIIEKDSKNQPIITYQKIIYDVFYNDDNSFTIWWRKPVSQLLKTRKTITTYRQTVVAMGIIGYHIQQISSHET